MPSDGKSQQLEQLLDIGRARGYVLFQEIDNILLPGRIREVATELDTILTELARNRIEVIDEPRTEDSIPHEDLLDQLEREELHGHLGNLMPIRQYLREVLTLSRLTMEEEKELSKQINQGGPDTELAEKRLIEANLWIALGTATHFTNRGLRFLDLIQEGNIGLMRAVKEYNHLRQYRFSTFATWWVRRAIIRSIEDSSK
jgi:RNA polymerase primary sigma factor